MIFKTDRPRSLFAPAAALLVAASLGCSERHQPAAQSTATAPVAANAAVPAEPARRGASSLSFGTILRVTNLRNNRSVNVRVVDRGPFAAPRRAQKPVIDLSRRAAEQLDFINAGRAQVRVEVLQWGRGLRT